MQPSRLELPPNSVTPPQNKKRAKVQPCNQSAIKVQLKCNRAIKVQPKCKSSATQVQVKCKSTGGMASAMFKVYTVIKFERVVGYGRKGPRKEPVILYKLTQKIDEQEREIVRFMPEVIIDMCRRGIFNEWCVCQKFEQCVSEERILTWDPYGAIPPKEMTRRSWYLAQRHAKFSSEFQ